MNQLTVKIIAKAGECAVTKFYFNGEELDSGGLIKALTGCSGTYNDFSHLGTHHVSFYREGAYLDISAQQWISEGLGRWDDTVSASEKVRFIAKVVNYVETKFNEKYPAINDTANRFI